MVAFLRRRAAAATEASVLALLLAMVAALVGLGIMSESRSPGAWTPIAAAEPVGQTLEGVLTIQPAGEQADGTHWTATLDTGERVVPVQISHADSHRPDLMGVNVQVEGSWSADGDFVAAAIDVVDPATDVNVAVDPVALNPATGDTRTLEGVLTFRHGDDFANGRRSVTRYVLSTDSGDIEVAFAHSPAAGLAGSRVRVTGVQDGHRLLVADGGTTPAAPATTASTASAGAKSLAVVLVNFSNDTSQPYTPAHAEGIAFTNADSVAAFYAEGSWGQLTLSGDVFGWFTIPQTNANCAYSTWSSSANTVASAAGIDLSTYDNVVYAFPSTSCGWAGLASMPGRTSWLNGPMAMSLRVMAHELGHNFGTHHASQYSCTESGVRVTLSATTSNCTSGEYGDPFSVMGHATRYQHTNFAKGNYNWLAGANTLTATTTGDYLLAPAEVQGAASVSSLRIQRTTSSWFTMEFRQPYGTSFETFSSTSPLANGVSIRITGSYATRSQSLLLDTTPATSSFIDAPLAPGQTFVDPLTGVSITTMSTSPAGAVVRITFGAGSSPSPSESPTPIPTVTPGPTATPDPSPTPSPSSSPSPSATPDPGDTQPPTAPGSLTASIARSKKVALTWTASSDNVRVSGYRVYRDGLLVATIGRTKWSDNLTLSAGTRRYEVVAFDAAGNTSPASGLTVAAGG